MAKLAAYQAKRDFGTTPEPEGREADAGGFAFVIQKHDATRLHYDLRLELDGVMKSWAVTKGPSLVPGDKRLAVHVEDHPVDYNGFEGTIPKGQYGGGTMLLWDRGRWVPEGDPHRGYAKGHLNFSLEGEKLSGAWHLVRMRRKPREKQEAWLLIKSEDSAARHDGDADVLDEQPLSVASGRTIEEIAADPRGAVWDSKEGLAADARAAGRAAQPSPAEDSRHEQGGVISGRREAVGKRTQGRAALALDPLPLHSAPVGDDKRGGREPILAANVGGRPDRVSRPSKGKPAAKARASRGRREAKADPNGPPSPDQAALTSGGTKAPIPKAVEPCLATLASAVPKGDRWIHEIKWDGYRLIAFKTGSQVRLATRRGHDWTARFPSIATAVAALPVESAILDGEAVIEDEHGIANFSALQNALSDEHGRVAKGAILYAFDLLYLDGFDLRSLPLEDRKSRLAALVPALGEGFLRQGEHIEADGEAMVRSACRLGLEGVISKRRDRPYRSGRGDDWVKVKCSERQEFVVVGYVPSSASRRAVGSLVLAYHEAGALRLAGRSGTGFTAESARTLWSGLDPLKRPTPPVAAKPSAEERRGVVWVEPRLVAEIEFRGWTADDHLRHAAYKGLREDKTADEVVRERPRPVPGEGPAPSKSSSAKAAPAPASAPAPAEPAPPARKGGSVEVAGVALTHPDRVLWNDAGITKQGLAEYYEAVAASLLPHIVERPLSLVRCPGGADGKCFFQKHSWAGLSDHILRETVRDEGGEEEILYVRDIAGVIALVQASVLEIHPWGATTADVDRADRITMDLDPGEDVPFEAVVAGAREVRDRLAAQGLESFVKTTGGKGLHVVVPLTGPAPWPGVKAFCKGIADGMAADSPGRFISVASKKARRGLIYVDYLRNGRGATAIAAFSTRARPGAPVSVPLSWEELQPGLRPNHFTIANLPARLASLAADPWAELSSLRQSLPARGGARPRSSGRG